MTRTLPAIALAVALVATAAPARQGPVVVTPPPVRMAVASGAARPVPVASAPVPAAAAPLAPWMATFRAEAAATGVPAGLLLAVAMVESGGDVRAVSVAGATGLLQVLPSAWPSLCPCGTPAASIHAGAVVLAHYARLAGASAACLASGPGGTGACAWRTDVALSWYNGGPSDPGMRLAYIRRVRAAWVAVEGAAA